MTTPCGCGMPAADDALRTHEGHNSAVNACAFAPDGRTLLSASDDYTLRLWDVETGRVLKIYTHLPAGETATLDPQGQNILWASPGAWRHLGWRIHDPHAGRVRILPAEYFGPLPQEPEAADPTI